MILIVDASVVCKWYLREALTDDALRLLESDYQLIAPDLVQAEATNTLWHRVRRGSIDIRHARDSVRRLAGEVLAFFPTNVALDRALSIAIEIEHPVYDAVYLAVAEYFDARVVTADDRFVARAAATRWRQRIVRLDYLEPAA